MALSKPKRRYMVLFLCHGGEIECPTCGRDWQETACQGQLNLGVLSPDPDPTMGQLAFFARYPSCPICGGGMYINNVIEV